MVILEDVKTAISISDELFAAADRLAERLGISRSRLYARAVREFLARHRQAEVTAALDRVYGEDDSRLDPALVTLQALSLGDDEW